MPKPSDDTRAQTSGLERHPELLDALLKVSVVGAVTIFLGQLYSRFEFERFYGLMLVFLVLGLSIFFRWTGRRRASVLTYISGMVFAIHAQALLVGGVQAPILIMMPPLVLIAGWLLSLRFSLVISVLSVCTVVAIEIAKELGYNQPTPILSGFNHTLLFTIVVVLTYASMSFLIRSHEVDVSDIRQLNATLQHQLVQIQNHEAAVRQSEAEVRILNAQLEARVAERTRELKDALDILQRAQEELVHAEKLASLGGLVAGVAHELNTPLGNALTAASALSDHIRELQKSLAEGALKKSSLDQFLSRANEGSDLVQRSLRRAADLVDSFKQVAVDQVSERRRTFALDEAIHEVIDTIRPNLKQYPWAIEMDIEPGIEVDGFPGPMGQVIINLVMNAAIHAFEGRQQGVIRIEGKRSDNQTLTVVVQDNGTGMDSQRLGRIFEPFFTTKLGQGGSGLGLAIVHRLISQVLGGSIQVESALGSGTRFVVHMPMVAPLLANR